jgi:hypothetical protein
VDSCERGNDKTGGSRRRNGVKVRMFHRIVLSPSSGCKKQRMFVFLYVRELNPISEHISLSNVKLLGSIERVGFIDLLRDILPRREVHHVAHL